jgi:hypothetical protein
VFAQPAGVPAGIVTPNDASTVRKARLAIPIQIKVCFFIYPNVRDDVGLVYWTLVVPTKHPSNSDLLCAPVHLAGIEIVIALDNPDPTSKAFHFASDGAGLASIKLFASLSTSWV